jgi:hypothetical protein
MSTPIEPAPLDGYLTAKPNEPIFVLQGGDPLAPPLVQQWITTARALALQLESESQRNALLIRATAAEEVLWAMQNYLRGHTSTGEVEPKTPLENSVDEKARLDVYDVRRRCASRIYDLRGAITEYRKELLSKHFISAGDELDNSIEGLLCSAKSIADRINIRRGNVSD